MEGGREREGARESICTLCMCEGVSCKRKG